MLKPKYLKIKDFDRKKYLKTLNLIKKHNLNTVCLSANCPNRYHCFSSGTATFMILGEVCTRNCRYCNIESKKPEEVDKKEPERLALAVKKLSLDYVVVTSVTRDDLEDGGSNHFINCISEIRKNNDSKIEVLIPDFKGDELALEKLVKVKPEIINHNIETVKELFSALRPQGDYNRSLFLLSNIKNINSDIITKSGLMVGLGETKAQILKTLKDLRDAKVDIITIGQYLAPSTKHAKVEKYYSELEFLKLKNIAKEIGFKEVISGPMVRSSYKAKEAYEKVANTRDNRRKRS
ncbi:MAG TPA: lipoyl synthase [Patescibacteria group bacterium]|nr:lipoyl synthase [Patescibacteria group bacterium]